MELITDYLEGSLPAGRRRLMDEHLSGCDPCVDYLGQIRTTVELSRRVAPAEIDPETTQRLVELYRTWQQPPP